MSMPLEKLLPKKNAATSPAPPGAGENSLYRIAPDGTVARRWDDVKVNGHAADVLRAVGEL